MYYLLWRAQDLGGSDAFFGGGFCIVYPYRSLFLNVWSPGCSKHVSRYCKTML